MTKILITGVTGFAGRALFENLKFKKKFNSLNYSQSRKIIRRGENF